MRKYKIAAVLMIMHGGFMELMGVMLFIPIMIWGIDKIDMASFFAFRLPYFQENLYMVVVIGGIYGIARIVGAIGLLKNRLWGVVLSVVNCTVTVALMMFLLPFGVVDGLFAYSSLILILTQYFGKREISSDGEN